MVLCLMAASLSHIGWWPLRKGGRPSRHSPAAAKGSGGQTLIEDTAF